MKVTVRRGDTLAYYSELFLVDLQLIIDSNNNIDVNNLQEGSEVIIPGYEKERYTIKSGETLWKIAVERHITVDAMLLLNQTVDPQQLIIGETIFLPKKITYFTVSSKQNYDSCIMQKDITLLKKNYPFIDISTIGKSVLNKPIHVITIGRGSKKVQYNASFHANEWITTSILMKLVNEYLLALTNNKQIRGQTIQQFYNEIELTIVPMVNPDGVDLVLNGPPKKLKARLLNINNGNHDFSNWKANIRGVDLNNQFPAYWEIEKKRKEPKKPAPRDYPGDRPLTEPEAKAMALLAERKRFSLLLALHSQGKEFYWGYEGLEHKKSAELAEEFTKVSNYKAVKYIDSHAGYRDWFIKKFRQPGFTLELGEGVNPLPIDQFDEIYKAMVGVFLASLYMK